VASDVIPMIQPVHRNVAVGSRVLTGSTNTNDLNQPAENRQVLVSSLRWRGFFVRTAPDRLQRKTVKTRVWSLLPQHSRASGITD
jgi:hypothetical protein